MGIKVAHVVKSCLLCGIKFSCKPSHQTRRKYCSKRCNGLAYGNCLSVLNKKRWANPSWRDSAICKMKLNHADVSGSNNPMWGVKRTDTGVFLSRYIKDVLRNNPEAHANRIMARHGRISRGHKILFVLMQKCYSKNPDINFPVITYKTTRFIDVAFPDLKLGFEYDEPYWHNAVQDADRDKELLAVGWVVKHAGPWILRAYKDLESEFPVGVTIPRRCPGKKPLHK